MTNHPTTTAETVVGTCNEALTAPRDRECLTCYLHRMLAEFGCNHELRWAMHWRDRNAPKAQALRRRLMDHGGFCDCEVLYNVFPWTLPENTAAPRPPCGRVGRRGSTNPCRPRYPRGRAAAGGAPYGWSPDGMRLVVPGAVTSPDGVTIRGGWVQVPAEEPLFELLLPWAEPNGRWPSAGRALGRRS
jgi:hypothetical protein